MRDLKNLEKEIKDIFSNANRTANVSVIKKNNGVFANIDDYSINITDRLDGETVASYAALYFDSISMLQLLNIHDFQNARRHIRFRLLNKNVYNLYSDLFLKYDKFDTIFGDLVYIPYIHYTILGSTEMRCFPIVEPMIDIWDVEKDEIMQTALCNMKFTGPDVINMLDFFDDIGINTKSIGDTEVPMYIITNRSKFYGAVHGYDTSIYKKISDDYNGGDVIIFPSSIHEMIVVPCLSIYSLDDMNMFVKKANESLESNEILADHAYIWRRDKDAIFSLASME